MFDIAPTELMLVALVALVVIGPKDLPRVLRVVGQWIGRARGMAQHFTTGIKDIVRQSEIEEMKRKWAEEDTRIMREHPPEPHRQSEAPASPAKAEPAAAAAPTPRPVQTDLPLDTAADRAA